ncbi:zinc-binding metallopeptidase family protein [Ilumatobacter nonamiensis]|uniref:zinc-binding metallopeptidase family protein n=1 Tax=Ilumatobacter nonamiensis TaxID=467093 RepID=UPI00034C0CA8|nr:putative zinc-binding metallopeptidase [Ilumatobacter nonamiensis]
MQPFNCAVCGQIVFFDNSTCLRCSSPLGYLRSERALVALETPEGEDDATAMITAAAMERADRPGRTYRRCANQIIARCNWLLTEDDEGELCASCRLTAVRPNDDEVDALEAFADAEQAKRRLLHQLDIIGLPVVGRDEDEERGVAFEFLSSRNQQVMTGHDGGVITLDLSESDDAHREFVRQQMGEAYRTVLGHLRHEIGHYYWPRLVVDADRVEGFRELFGDETISYQDALDQHYADGDASTSWVDSYVSEYATMHPWEDWAETFAHYLHIRAGLHTAKAYGITIGEPAVTAARETYTPDVGVDVGPTVQAWLGLTLGLNAMSRSIGEGDLYPFVLSTDVIAKLDFVHRCVTAGTEAPATDRSAARS